MIPQGYKHTELGIIPQEWEVLPLSASFCLQGGFAFKSEYFSEDIGVPIVRISNLPMEGQYVNLSDCVYYPKDIDIREQFILQKQDLLIAMSGATTGKTAIYNEDYYAYLNQRVGVFRQESDRILSSYLQIVVNSKLFTDRLQPLLIAGAQPNIAPKDIEQMRFPVPPVEEQRKIAEILGVWDKAIELQARLVDKLELRKRALMQRLLTGRLRLPGFSNPWQKYTYAQILKEVKRTLKWDDNEKYHLISVRRRSGGLFQRESLYGHEIKTKNLRPAYAGDFLISKMQIVHGASGLTTQEFHDMKISGSYIALVTKNPQRLNIEYLNFWSQMPAFYHHTFISSFGVHIEKMTFDIDSFMSLVMSLPSITEQNKIVDIITTANKEIEIAKAKLAAYRTQKRGLMQQLLTGKKRVKNF